MSSPEVLDFEKLLAPISDDAPCGQNVRRPDGSIDPEYDRAKSAAQEARTLEREKLKPPRAEGEAPPAPPNWKKVEQETSRILATKSKDLWVTAWLLESLVRLYGFAGARDGFRLVRQLAEQYWEHLLPVPSESDGEHPLDYKLSQLAALNGTESDGVLIAPLRAVPLLVSDDFGDLSLGNYTVAAKIASISDPDVRQKRIESTKAATIEDFDKAALHTPVDTLRSLVGDIQEALDELAKMSNLLDEKCQEDGTSYSPPTSNIRGVLNECLECAEAYLRKVSPTAASEAGGETPPAAGGAPAATPAAGGTPGGVAGPLRSREDAFRLLLQLADYFRRTEPHSPLSYSLEQAVRWGRQPLPDLLKELIRDDAVRAEVYRLAGIPAPEE